MSKVYVNDGYMMLLDAIYFNGKKIGNVSDDGIDWGGLENRCAARHPGFESLSLR